MMSMLSKYLDLSSHPDSDADLDLLLLLHQRTRKNKRRNSDYLKKRSSHGEFVLTKELCSERFTNYFRLNKAEFQEVHSLVQPLISSGGCNAQKPIGSEEKLAVFLSLAEEGTHAELVEKKGHYYSLITADASLEEDSKMDLIEAKETNEKHKFESQNEADVIVTEEETKEQANEEVYKAPLSRIISLNKPDWPYILAGSVASFLNGCISPVSAVFFGNMYGVLSEPDERVIISSTNIYSIGFIAIGILSLLFVFIQMSTLTLAGVRMTSRLRVDVFRAMLRQEMAWFDDERQCVGSLCAKLSGDTSSIQAATGSKLGSLLQGVSCLGVGTIISFLYSWKMTILCLTCVPFTLMTIIFEARVMDSEGTTEKQALEEATKIAVEALAAVRTVQSLGQEPAVVERYTRKLAEAEIALRKKTKYRGVIWGLSQVSTTLCYGVSLSIGGYLVAKGGEPYMNIVIVSEALLFGAWMLAHVVSFAPNLQKATISAGRLFKILDRKPQLYTTTDSSTKTWDAIGQIDYSNVHFAYPNRPAVEILHGIGLSIPKGKKVALVGASGCGKSTIIQLLQRFYDPVSGSVKISNQNTIDVPVTKLRGEIGIVSQEPVLFDRTIAENIAYGDNTRAVSMSEVMTAAKHANVHAFITSLPAGYETRLGFKGTQLSGGQKQRIAIARALVRNPRIIILDEATSALDSQSEKLVQEALDEASAGRTCIVIAHRLSTVTNADVICVLQRGRVVELGSHSELLALGGHYAQLLQSQQSS